MTGLYPVREHRLRRARGMALTAEDSQPFPTIKPLSFTVREVHVLHSSASTVFDDPSPIRSRLDDGPKFFPLQPGGGGETRSPCTQAARLP